MRFIDCHGHAYRKDTPVQTKRARFCTPEEVIERYNELGIYMEG